MSSTTVEHDGMTVWSNTETEEAMRTALGAAEKPVETPAELPDATKTDVDTNTSDHHVGRSDPGSGDVVGDKPAPDAAGDAATEAGRALAAQRKKDGKSFQSRIDELTAKQRQAERERDEARAELQRRSRVDPRREDPQTAVQPEAKAPEYLTRPKPLLTEFEKEADPYAAWMEALSDWKADEKLAARDQATQREQAERTERERFTQFQARHEAARVKYPDFDTVMASDAASVPVPDWIRDYIVDSELGQDLRYYLVTHRSDLDRLVALSPLKAVAALGKLEDKLETPTGDANGRGTAPAPAGTTAKPIPTPLGGSPLPVTDAEDDPNEPLHKYVSRMNAKESKAASRR